jgi:PAS domain S-box-containing protein
MSIADFLSWRMGPVQKTSVGDLGFGAGSDDFPIVITTLPANARQHKIAFCGFAIVVVVVAIVMLANIQTARVDAFVPVIQTMMCIADLLTAAFLFAQFSVQPQRALLALASGFVSSGLFAFLQTLAFPGAYGPGVLIGDELSSAGWLFLSWHTIFPLAAIIYAVLKDAGEAANRSRRSTGAAIGITIACVVAVTAALTWGATAGAQYLPRLFKNAIEQERFARGGEVFVTLLSIVAIVLLFVRRRTILDQWLIVTLSAWLPNLGVASFFVLHRFTLGWYMARAYALFAGSSLLFVLLMETLLLYTRLANTVVLLRRSEQHHRLLVAQLEEREMRLQEALTAGAVIAFEWDVSTDLVQRSNNTAQVLGLDPQQTLSGASFCSRVHPDDLAHMQASWGSLNRDNPTCSITYRFLRLDNREVWLQETSKAEFDGAGRLVRIRGLARDISGRKRAEEHQTFLMRELDHRVKNVFARVTTLAASMRTCSTSIDDYVRSLNGRIESMATAHSLLSKSGWQNVGLDALVRQQLAPYTTGSNVTISGEDITLGAGETQAVAVVLYELVTNAAKYGSLSVPEGRVCVSWDRQKLDAGVKLMLEWRELGGPPVAAEFPSGYGMSLIRNLIPHELGGRVDLIFAPDGVNCKIEIPLEQA